MNRTLVALVALGSVIVACGSADEGTAGDTTETPAPAKQDPKKETSATEPSAASLHACVKKGATGNDKGVGAYCEKTSQCGDGLLCTKDFGAGPDEPWFCTLPCEEDSECGAGATCYAETRGKGCLPNACKPK